MRTPPQILIVDDNAANLDILETRLETFPAIRHVASWHKDDLHPAAPEGPITGA